MSGPRHQDLAETVRAYLVGLRGGAVFLSSSDARLLQRWLDDEVPLWLILEGLDKAAEKRRAKRQRTPLSLQHAKGHVNKGLKTLERRVPAVHTLAQEAPDLQLGETPESAVKAIVAFHESSWDHSDQEAWRAKAAKELEPLRDVLSAERFRILVEETARDLLRQARPELCASRLWDTGTA